MNKIGRRGFMGIVGGAATALGFKWKKPEPPIVAPDRLTEEIGEWEEIKGTQAFQLEPVDQDHPFLEIDGVNYSKWCNQVELVVQREVKSREPYPDEDLNHSYFEPGLSSAYMNVMFEKPIPQLIELFDEGKAVDIRTRRYQFRMYPENPEISMQGIIVEHEISDILIKDKDKSIIQHQIRIHSIGPMTITTA